MVLSPLKAPSALVHSASFPPSSPMLLAPAPSCSWVPLKEQKKKKKIKCEPQAPRKRRGNKVTILALILLLLLCGSHELAGGLLQGLSGVQESIVRGFIC